jgi:hypothetical protein
MAKILTQRLFRRNLFGLVPLVMVSHFSSGSASAQGYDANSRCLLEIDGTTYLDGRCYFKNGAKDDFFRDPRLQITCPNGVDAAKASCSGAEQRVTTPGVFGYLFRDKGLASLCWNERTMTKASPCFPGLRRSGACWSNPRAKKYGDSKVQAIKFCAWKE